MQILRFSHLGSVDYDEAISVQERILASGKSFLLLMEHPTVITVGRSAPAPEILIPVEALRERQIPVFRVDRGGRTFLHLPGQLILYPILNLGEMKPDLDWYIRSLESVIIAVLQEYGIFGERRPGATGVWVGEKKIAGIGVKVRKWWTSHGLALNVCPALEVFSLVLCCGMPCQMTSMEAELRKMVDTKEVASVMVRHFGRVFGLEMQEGDASCLLEM